MSMTFHFRVFKSADFFCSGFFEWLSENLNAAHTGCAVHVSVYKIKYIVLEILKLAEELLFALPVPVKRILIEIYQSYEFASA